MAYPTTSEEETLHPYYDDIENDSWLVMSVNQTNPISVTFGIRRPNNWDDLLFNRVSGHFKSYELENLYATQAARELVGIRHNLIRSFSSGGRSSVEMFLFDSADSWEKVNKNSWHSAFYRGLSTDQWFCETGFTQIG
jgi:hypothetical protein